MFFFFSSRRRHTRLVSDWSSDVCSSDLDLGEARKPRPHDEPLPVAGKLTRELLEEPRPDRARADERHVAPEHVPELRRSEEHTSELQSLTNLVCRLLLEKKHRNPNSWTS